MKIAINWLNDYLSVPQKAEELATLLTDTGLEVESIASFQNIENSLENVIVGEVLSCEKHPDADRLKITSVNVGQNDNLQIVCGAPNVAAGQKVMVALIGSVLHPDGKKMPIKKTKIRGVESNGMICAEDELGIGKNHEGILELPATVEPGTTAADYFKVYKDAVLDIDITPNRVDAASYLGVAKDVVARHTVQGKNTTLQNPAINALEKVSMQEEVDLKITVEDFDLCPRYSGIVVKDVVVKPSPEWLQNRLKSVGIKPQNNVVDIANFVLLETGHPLHAFDVDKIKNRHIKVRSANKSEQITTLDGETRNLKEGQLLICDAEKPMCIAGIYGGINSGVKEKTQNIFIESAFFNPTSIRKTAKHFGLNTDASFRFERGADISFTLKALNRAVHLLEKYIDGASVASPVFDIYPKPVEPHQIILNFNFLQKIAGVNFNQETVKQLLQCLDIKIAKQNNDELLLIIPPAKVDVTRPIDVVEEVMRIYGYNYRQAAQHLNLKYTIQPELLHVALIKKTKNILVQAGYIEAVNLSFTSDRLSPQDLQNSQIKISNPISEDLNVLRQTLLIGLLQNVEHNLKRQQNNVCLFEFGRIFNKNKKEIVENNELGIIVSGQTDENWHSATKNYGFFHLKGIVERIFNELSIAVGKTIKTEQPAFALQSFSIIHPSKLVLAEISQIKKQFLKPFGIKQDVWFVKINWANVLQLAPKKHKKVRELPKFPAVRRDLALLMPEDVQYAQLKAIAKKQAGKILESINIFDFYQGKGIEKGQKSYALCFTFKNPEQTLTDKVVDAAVQQIIDAYKNTYNIVLR